MKTIFITGDRSIPWQLALGVVATTVLKEIVTNGGDVQLATGTEDGVEAAVRFACEKAGVALSIFESTDQANGSGKRDFALRTASVLVSDPETRFVVVHGDPHSSRITKAIMDNDHVGEFELVLPQLI